MTTLSPSIKLIDYSGRSWSDIKFIHKESPNHIKSSASPKDTSTTKLLPRRDYAMFGQFPKLDNKALIRCDKCDKIVLPCVYKAHCNNPEHEKLKPLEETTQAAAKSQSASRTRKSAAKTPAAAAIHASSSSNSSHNNVTLSMAKTLPVLVAAAPEIHPKKKPKYDFEHVAVAPPSIGKPITLTIHNNRIEMRTKESDKEPTSTSIATTNNVATSYSISHSNSRSTFIKLGSPLPTMPLLPVKKEVVVAVKVKKEPVVDEPVHKISQGIKQENTNTMVHMPINPVAVVNIVPVEYLQQYLNLPTQPIVVTIPCTNAETHLYSYPKPLTAATRAIRKIGSTYLLQNQNRLEQQRAEIQSLLRSAPLNHLPT